MNKIYYFTPNDFKGAIFLLLNKKIPEELSSSEECSHFIHSEIRKGNKTLSGITMADIDKKIGGASRFLEYCPSTLSLYYKN